MHSIDLPTPILIRRPEALEELVAELAQEAVIAVDTESNSLYAYQEQVCLIQFSTTQKDYLVDPLSFEDASVLAPLFASASVEKVFHAAEYDVMTMKRDFGFEFDNLFDTMLAARILGWKKFGLGSILETHFGVRLNKRYQRANWGQRPLPRDMLAYAQLDTHYLIPLRDRLQAELKAAGRWDLAMEDFERLRHVDEHESNNVDESCWRVSGAYDLPAQRAAVLQELCLYRDKMAKSMDRPLFKVINDRSLLAIAETAPRSLKELRRLPGMSDRQVQRHGEGLLRAVEQGLSSEPLYPPRSPRPDEDYLERVDALRYWRKVTARQMGVNSDVVMPRDLLYTIASKNPRVERDLNVILDEVPWRRERFGGEILEVLDDV
jgi:ribonuclease D